MTTDPDPGVKLRALAIVFVIVFAVTVTGGYATTAILTDGESVEMTFDLAGNVGNTAGNSAGNTADVGASMADPGIDPGEESPPTNDRSAAVGPPSNEVLAASAKHGATN